MVMTLTPSIEARIRDLIDSGQYPDADAVLLDALQLLEERNQERFLALREKVRAGFESGEGVELTPELWDQLVREADEEDRLGLPIRDDVTP
jgi:putative addiction module CopG family antidote